MADADLTLSGYNPQAPQAPSVLGQVGLGALPALWQQNQVYNQQTQDYSQQVALQRLMQQMQVQRAQGTLQSGIGATNATNNATAASIGTKMMGEANQQGAAGDIAQATKASTISANIAENTQKGGAAAVQELDNAVSLAVRVNALGNDPSLAARIPEMAQAMGIPPNSPVVQALQRDPQGTAQHLAGAQAIVKGSNTSSTPVAGPQGAPVVAQGGTPTPYAAAVSNADPKFYQSQVTAKNLADAELLKARTQSNIAAGAETESARIRGEAENKSSEIMASAQKNIEATVSQASKRITDAQRAGKQPDKADIDEYNNGIAAVSYFKKIQVMTQQAGIASMTNLTPPTDTTGPPPTWQGGSQPQADSTGLTPQEKSVIQGYQPDQQSWIVRAKAANPSMSIDQIVAQGKKIKKL